MGKMQNKSRDQLNSAWMHYVTLSSRVKRNSEPRKVSHLNQKLSFFLNVMRLLIKKVMRIEKRYVHTE